ncbi:MAG: Adenine-specific methyltransferase [Polaromonas sp.]|nr:Adenine-specific methyltransferase [Polaromonas sp.]
MGAELHHGDCIEVMRGMADASVDSVVTDPPYGIRFMGKAWDGADIEARYSTASATTEGRKRNGMAMQAGRNDRSPSANLAFQQFSEDWAVEAFRVLKPGGFLLSFSAPRTYHRMVSGIEDAGFEIRDQIMWLYGSGFPKSHNLDGDRQGWGTALKPAHEPIVVARKPLVGTVAANVLAHGTGALNIDGCRVATDDALREGSGGTWNVMHKHEGREGEASADRTYAEQGGTNFAMKPGQRGGDASGRWPANVIHDGGEAVVASFPFTTSGSMSVNTKRSAQDEPGSVCYGTFGGNIVASDIFASSGSAARFFYCAKASKADRDEGLHGFALQEAGVKNVSGRGFSSGDPYGKVIRQNTHPTVKPTDLMAYLCRLVTPPGGTVLDPFMGSGSTGKACMLEGFSFIGIDLSAEYIDIARARIENAKRQDRQPSLEFAA